MKKVLAVFSILLVLFFSGCNSENSTQESSAALNTDSDKNDLSSWQKAYFDVLMNEYNKIKNSKIVQPDNFLHYDLYDVDNNSIPELIISKGSLYGGSNQLYMYSGNQSAKLVGSFAPGNIKCNCFTKEFFVKGYSSKSFFNYLYSFKNDKLTKEKNFVVSNKGYSIDDKLCEKEQYFKEFDRYNYQSWDDIGRKYTLDTVTLSDELKDYSGNNVGDHTWLEAYPEFLINLIDSENYIVGTEFGFADIDKDKCAELFLIIPKKDSKSLEIYSIYDNRIIKLWSMTNYNNLKIGKNKLFVQSSNSSEYYFFTKKNMNLIPEKIFKVIPNNTTNESTFIIDHSETNHDEFFLEFSSMMSSDSFANIKTYLLNEETVFNALLYK